MKKVVIIFLSLLSLTAFAFSDPNKAYLEMKDGKAVIIDVRESDEIAQGTVKDAKWFALSKTKNNENWKQDFSKMVEGKKVYLYCRSGHRAEQLRTLLKESNMQAENLGGFESLKKIIPFSTSN